MASEIERTYYVQDKRTKKILNQDGGWSRDLLSYRLRRFDSEVEATAAIPEGIDCWVFPMGKRRTT